MRVRSRLCDTEYWVFYVLMSYARTEVAILRVPTSYAEE